MQTQLKNYEKQLKVNGIYKHYKGKRYKILMIVWNSEVDELEPWVVYQGLYDDPKLGPNPIFTRSLNKFSEMIMIDNVKQPRFKLIDFND